MTNWWPGDGTATDITGTDDGTLFGGAGYGPGKVGQSFTFVGGSSGVSMPYTALHQQFTAMTIDAWVFPTAHGVNADGYGLTVVSNTNSDGFALRLRNGLIQADFRLPADAGTAVFTSATVPLNQWSHVAITYDGTAERGYLNGILVGSRAASGPILNGANSTTCPMIGNEPEPFCAVQSSGFGFIGSIDEVEIFERALSQPEILAIVNAGQAGKCRDTDGDGYDDTVEIELGSDPHNLNSTPEVCDGVDNDLNDGIDEGFTNTDGDAEADCVDSDDDNDGFGDSIETAAGSDPLNAASTPEVCDGIDNDLNDGVDEGFTNTDGDGMADCVDADDDNDGQSDAGELACGSDPLNAASKATDRDADNIPDCIDTVVGPPTNIDQCKNSGWQFWTRPDGSRFKNQGDCVSYVNTGR